MATNSKRAAKAQGLDSSAKLKLALAIGLLVIAGAYFAYSTFGGSGPEPVVETPMTPEEVQKREVEIQEAKAAAEEIKKRPGTVEAGE
ncbi:MAG: hypothetical protein AB7K52_09400 [Phycisphaerales bacterium]